MLECFVECCCFDIQGNYRKDKYININNIKSKELNF